MTAYFRGQLFVSCQASPGDPLEDTEAIRRIARAVAGAGAAGLRINSADHIAAIRKDTDLPIIGIHKRYVNGALRITPDFSSAAALAAAGATIIALDCTHRTWRFGEPWQEILRNIREKLGLPVMADIATAHEAVAAVDAGADFVGTTLNGYTEETRYNRSFSWSLLAELTRRVQVPIIAEGHISTPEEARRAIAEGASCVVVGNSITRPGAITARFLRAIRGTGEGAPAIGVDIGGTTIKAGVIARNGEVSMTVRVPTEAPRGRDAIAANFANAVEQVLIQARAAQIAPCGLGIATGGAVNPEDGSIFAATENLPGWSGFKLRRFAEDRFRLPTWALNDAHAVVLAERHFGRGAGLSDFAVITLGTGIGGGVVCNGRLLQGHHGFAGTLGHHTIHVGGLPCNCGRQGCLEAYVSTAALVREYLRHSGKTPDPAMGSDGEFAWQINRLALAGDADAQKAYSCLGRYLAEGIANLFTIFDPQAVLLSGGLIEGLPGFIDDVGKSVTEILPFGAKRAPEILPAAAGTMAGIQGAGALVFSELAL